MNDKATHRGRVLLADDDADVRRPLAIALEHAGFSVQTAANGHDASRLLDLGGYDVVLADINMPGNQRLEFVRAHRAGQSWVPIVIITGYPSLDTAIDAIRLGVVDYVTKPIDPRLLFVRLDEAIQKGRLLSLIDQADERVSQMSRWLESMKAAIRTGGAPGPFGVGADALERAAAPSLRVDDVLSGLAPDERAKLSPRERDVLCELARGRRVREVSSMLGLSTNTVRNHLKSIFIKLGVTSQVQLLSRIAGRG